MTVMSASEQSTPPPTGTLTPTKTDMNEKVPRTEKMLMASSPTFVAETSKQENGVESGEELVLNKPFIDAKTSTTKEQDENIEFFLLKDVNIRVRRRPVSDDEEATFEACKLAELLLPLNPTLEDMRVALCSSELGHADRDIFFPKWNKSLYVTIDGEEGKIENNHQLDELVKRELMQPGSFTLNLQECRDARYSRRKHVFVPHMLYNPYLMYQPNATNNAVYFDGALAPPPTNAYYHPYACQFIPPFPPMQFMYVPMQGNHI